jgi:hypothetical protein
LLTTWIVVLHLGERWHRRTRDYKHSNEHRKFVPARRVRRIILASKFPLFQKKLLHCAQVWVPHSSEHGCSVLSWCLRCQVLAPSGKRVLHYLRKIGTPLTFLIWARFTTCRRCTNFPKLWQPSSYPFSPRRCPLPSFPTPPRHLCLLFNFLLAIVLFCRTFARASAWWTSCGGENFYNLSKGVAVLSNDGSVCVRAMCLA